MSKFEAQYPKLHFRMNILNFHSDMIVKNYGELSA